MRATIQLDNSPVGQLLDVVSLPQNSVRPGRCSRLLARVPIIGARIELVGRRERRQGLAEVVEGPTLLSDLVQLIT